MIDHELEEINEKMKRLRREMKKLKQTTKAAKGDDEDNLEREETGEKDGEQFKKALDVLEGKVEDDNTKPLNLDDE